MFVPRHHTLIRRLPGAGKFICGQIANVPLRQSLHAAIARLSAEHVPSPRLNAELLLMFVLGCDRAYLHAHPEHELSAEEQSRYDHALAERARGVPAQYITGHQEFWGMDFIVSPAVLIPRPETEHLIETVLRLNEKPNHRGHGEAQREAEAQSLRIVDVGTGSGCIALALAKELPSAEIHATDISAAALDIARANAARHQLTGRIQFHQADLLMKLEIMKPEIMNLEPTNLEPARDAFDFVVSNPPYVGESEEDTVQLEVRKFEPRQAVFAGPSGLEVIERLIPQAQAALKPGGWLVMEISGAIADGVTRLLSRWQEVSLVPDLQNIPRVASARKSLVKH